MNKYELTCEIIDVEKTVYRIRALRDIPRYGVRAGDLGGCIAKESNLSQQGNAWVQDEAQVYNDASVWGDAWIRGYARIYGKAKINGKAQVYDNALVHGNAWVHQSAEVYGDANVWGDAIINGDAEVGGDAVVYAYADVSGNAILLKGKYTCPVTSISVGGHSITPCYPNHVIADGIIYKMCCKDEMKERMRANGIHSLYHNQIWSAILLCKKWLKENPDISWRGK